MTRYIFILTILFSLTILLADGVQPFGSGTDTDPYQIETLDNLLWVSTNNTSWDKHFIQTTDFSASETINWNNGAGFSPIGSIETPFTGSYDGQSLAVIGLYINNPEEFNMGMFGKILDSTIQNVQMFSTVVTGNFNAGGLVAHAYNSVLNNCFVESDVVGGTNVGGLVGIAEGSSLSYLRSISNVTAEEFLGSLIGQCYQTSMDNCSSFGTVEGIGNLGGLAGLIFDSEVNNCFSYANVDAFMSAGGFAGVIMNGAVIDKCYSIGSVVNGVADIGGLIGMNINANTYNSFWDTDTSGLIQSDGGVGKTTAQMQETNTYTDVSTIGLDEAWDFVGNPFDDVGDEDHWNIFDQYPLLTPINNVSSFDEDISDLNEHVLLRNYPNPFNPSTTISFNISGEDAKDLNIVIYNTKGQKVETLPVILSGIEGTVGWNARKHASGIYFYQLVSRGKALDTKQMLLIK
jgi:hypothetical protein